MKIKQENGFTGIDAIIAMIVILIFMSILAVLFYNIKIENKDAERKSRAVSIATQVIETLKAKQYDQVKIATGAVQNNKGVEVQKVGNTYQYTSSINSEIVSLGNLNIEQGYTVYVKVENHVPQGENLDLVKKITVTVNYKVANEVKEVFITTAIVKNGAI